MISAGPLVVSSYLNLFRLMFSFRTTWTSCATCEVNSAGGVMSGVTHLCTDRKRGTFHVSRWCSATPEIHEWRMDTTPWTSWYFHLLLLPSTAENSVLIAIACGQSRCREIGGHEKLQHALVRAECLLRAKIRRLKSICFVDLSLEPQATTLR